MIYFDKKKWAKYGMFGIREFMGELKLIKILILKYLIIDSLHLEYKEVL
jgi:hypothetical protein